MFDSPLSMSAYEVLGVDPGAGDEELRRAYRLRLRQTHPDTGGDAAAFIRVRRAWELIGSPEDREAYDRGHGFAETAEPAAWSASAPMGTRVAGRSHGEPGARRRRVFEEAMRAGFGDDVDPYDPRLVRRAPVRLRAHFARALAEEETARTIGSLGMGFEVWHGLGRAGDGLDHVVLSPTGLYGIASLDAGGPVRLRRDEIVGDDAGEPVAELQAGIRAVARAARVRFGGAILTFPDADLTEPVAMLEGSGGLPVAVASRDVLATLLRRGVPGARRVGGVEVFDVRTRLRAVLREE